MDVSSDHGDVVVDITTPYFYPYTETVDNGVMVSLKAIPDFLYVFDGWSGDLSGKDSPELLLMDCNKTVTANFSLDWRLISTFGSSVILAIFLALVLLFRRKGPDRTTTDTEETEE